MKIRSHITRFKSKAEKERLFLGLLYLIVMTTFYSIYFGNFILSEKYYNFSDVDLIILFLPYIATVIELKISKIGASEEKENNLDINQLKLDVAKIITTIAFIVVFISFITKFFLPIIFGVSLLTILNIFTMFIKFFNYVFVKN